MLQVNDLSSGYSDLSILNRINLVVKQGEVVGLIGANGAGKTTLMNTIIGATTLHGGEILFNGESLNTIPRHRIAGRGLILVPEGRMLFPHMSVKENLELGAIEGPALQARANTLDNIYSIFPRLYERRRQNAVTLSGGEQQMLAIGRGLMAKPKMLMLDEPSLALAPILVDLIFSKLQEVAASGVTILIAEQNVSEALQFSDRAYVLEQGEITLEGTASELLGDDRVREAFLGL